ncbi:MAG: hypothetical protein ABI947_05145 [Chloroflexota bacterium]
MGQFIPFILIIGAAALLFWLGAHTAKITWYLILLGFLSLLGLFGCITAIAVSDDLIAFLVAISVVPIMALSAALILLVFLPGKRKLFAGVIVLTIPISIWLSIEVGSTFSPDAIIEQDARTIAQALVQYHSVYKTYPKTLKELVPQYIANLHEPTTLWGWVYKTTEDTFFIGYVTYIDRDGYSLCYWSLESSQNSLKWDCVLPPDSASLFHLEPTPMMASK